MKQPLITIITVVYNDVATLEATILSVLEQTSPAIEYIIIDGGSTDGSVAIITNYVAKQVRPLRITKWISERDTGIYNAMNKGVRLATGEWVGFLNSGDVFTDNTIIQQVVQEITSCHCGLDLQTPDILYGDVLIRKANLPLYVKLAKEPCNLHKMYFSHQSAFVKTDLLRQYPFDEQYKICADYKFFKQCYHARCQFKHLNFPVAIFDKSGISSTQRKYLYYQRVR